MAPTVCEQATECLVTPNSMVSIIQSIRPLYQIANFFMALLTEEFAGWQGKAVSTKVVCGPQELPPSLATWQGLWYAVWTWNLQCLT